MSNFSKTVDITTAVRRNGNIFFTSKEIAPEADLRDMNGCHATMQTPNGWVAYCAKSVDDKGVWHFRAHLLQTTTEGKVRPVPEDTQVDVLVTMHGQRAK